MNQQESKKLENKALKILKEHIKSSDTIIAGISGGPDSVFLLNLLNKVSAKIIVAHINHGLRKTQADLDEKFVKDLTKSHNSIFELKTVDVLSLSKKSKKGIEETGRKIRYDFFRKLAKKDKARFIITAHHADDNLETIIMNFTRGASLQGLSGIETIEQFTDQTLLFRPLLPFTKKQILSYLKFHKIKYRIDKSNLDTIYKRNFIRHKIIPSLQKLNPSLTESVAANTENLKEINNFLKKTAQKWISKNALNKEKTRFNGKSFRAQDKSIQKQILMEIYKNHTGSLKNIERIHIDEVLKILLSTPGNKKKKLGSLVVSIKNSIIQIH